MFQGLISYRLIDRKYTWLRDSEGDYIIRRKTVFRKELKSRYLSLIFRDNHIYFANCLICSNGKIIRSNDLLIRPNEEIFFLFGLSTAR